MFRFFKSCSDYLDEKRRKIKNFIFSPTVLGILVASIDVGLIFLIAMDQKTSNEINACRQACLDQWDTTKLMSSLSIEDKDPMSAHDYNELLVFYLKKGASCMLQCSTNKM